jgi:hypothetical protein
MKTIKKTTLIAAITAMAAIAVPSMASAQVWTPLNTNKTLTSTAPVRFVITSSQYSQMSFTCASSTLGVHVRGPASSTLDITSASYTNCTSIVCGSTVNATVTPTGLPWAANAPGSNIVYFAERLHVVYSCAPGSTFTVDGGTESGTYNSTTHTLSVNQVGPMALGLGGVTWAFFSGGIYHDYHETTNTLNLI